MNEAPYLEKVTIKSLHSCLAVIFIYIATGCATIEPNVSIIDKAHPTTNKQKVNQNFHDAKALLNILYNKNPQLSYEIGKIPEFHDDVGADELAALESFVTFYLEYEYKFNLVFNEMYLIGLPDVRKFCSLVQAYFWLFLDDKVHVAERLLNNYSTEKLLYEAWVLEHNKHYHRWRWRTQEAYSLFHSCLDPQLKKDIIAYYEKNQGAIDYIISTAEKFPTKFNHRYKPFNYSSLNRKHRWREKKIVINRLNAPELIHFYIYYEFFYEPNEYNTPKKMFRKKAGNCKALAELGQYLLKKAGFDTFLITVKDQDSICCKEHTGSGIITEKGDFILVVDMPKGKSVSGPYKRHEIEKVLRTGNCMPPPSRQFKFNLPKDFFQQYVENRCTNNSQLEAYLLTDNNCL